MSLKFSFGIRETAAALGLSRSTIYRLIDAGELATFKIGTRTLILRQTLDAFVERRAMQPAP